MGQEHVRRGEGMKIDILESKQLPCEDCKDPFGVIFASDGGICTSRLCFQCIIIYLQDDGFQRSIEHLRWIKK